MGTQNGCCVPTVPIKDRVLFRRFTDAIMPGLLSHQSSVVSYAEIEIDWYFVASARKGVSVSVPSYHHEVRHSIFYNPNMETVSYRCLPDDTVAKSAQY